MVSLALADAGTSSLSWVRLEGADSCIAAPELARAVEEQLGRNVFVPPSAAEFAVEGRVEPVEGGWRAVVRLTDGSGAVLGDRTVESRTASCAELGRVAATTIALMIDPIGAPEPEPPRRWGVELGAAVTAGGGAVPGVGLGGIGLVALTPPRFVPVLAEGELVPFSRVEAEGVRADFSRVVGGVQICPLRVGAGPIRLDACLGLDAGVIFLLSSTVALDASEWVLVQAHGMLHVRYRVVGPFLLRAGLHPVVPLRAVSFARADDPERTVYAPSPFAASLDLGVGLEF